MGASSWQYFTSYKENVQEALEDLRQAEFSAGRYYKLGNNLPENFEDWVRQLNLPADQLNDFKAAYDQLKELGNTTPATIEELIELNEDSGTHSIIDIYNIEQSFDLDQSGTITNEDLIRLFGTDKPTHQMVEEKADELQEFRGRGNCTYIVVYKDGRPEEIFFTGYSGD